MASSKTTKRQVVGKSISSVLVTAADFEGAMDEAKAKVQGPVSTGWRFVQVVGKRGQEHVWRLTQQAGGVWLWRVELRIRETRPVSIIR